MHTHEMYEASLAVRRAKDTLARLSEWAAVRPPTTRRFYLAELALPLGFKDDWSHD